MGRIQVSKLGHRQQPYAKTFYSVAIGRNPGIYDSWEEAKSQVMGFSKAKYKKFSLFQEAQDFLNAHISPFLPTLQPTSHLKPSSSKLSVLPSTSLTSSIPPLLQPSPLNHLDHSWIPLEKVDLALVKTSDLVAFCDGSALDNGRVTAKAGWACVFPNKPEWTSSASLSTQPTNNRAEYTAALKAIERANVYDPTQSKPLHIFSDSQLLIKSMTLWVRGWMSRHWKKRNGEPVLNADLLSDIIQSSGKRRILWTHVPAHTGQKDWCSFWNDQADALAKRAAS